MAEAARLLRVSPSTVWRWIVAACLTAYRVGLKNIRIRRSDLELVIAPAKSWRKAVPEPAGAQTAMVPRCLTDEEQTQALETLAAMRQLTTQMRQRRSGQPMAETWEDINRARDERSRQLLDR